MSGGLRSPFAPTRRPKGSRRWPAAAIAAAVMATTAMAVTALALAFSGSPAAAQSVQLFVNGDPITTYDIEQRTRFLQISTRNAPSQSAVIQDLIDERLKVQYAKRFQLDITEKDVDVAYSEMAKRMGLPADQLTKGLSSAGVNPATLKAKIKADITWQQIVRGRYQSSFQIRESDVLAAIETRKSGEAAAAGYEYTLQPILFVVVRPAPAGAVETRTREAEALRARFVNCEEGLRFARAIRDVAVREPVRRNSGDLPAPLREILDNTAVGRLTAPEVTQHGVEMFALCEKKEQNEASPVRRQVRDELFAETFQAKSKKLLQELRRGAMIERVK